MAGELLQLMWVLIIQHFSKLLFNTRVPMGQSDHFVLSNGKQVELAQAESSLAAMWRKKLWAPFVPEGFPHSVTQDYTSEYAIRRWHLDLASPLCLPAAF